MTERLGDRADRADRGAVLVLATLLLTGLMVIAAIVVDLGHMRNMRRSNQSVVDFAALAAGEALSHPDGPDAERACVDAVTYLRLNAPGLTDLDVDCETLPDICLDGPTALTPTTPVSATASAGGYDVAITYPVADSMINDSRVTTGLRDDDGEPCERMMVEVEQRSDSFFAGVMGRDELVTQSRAVVRQIPERVDQVPSLWLLDPHGCDVLKVTGGAQVRAGTATFGGLISADSTGTDLSSCTGNRRVVDVGGSGTLLEAFPTDVDPPGQITLVAIVPGQQGCVDLAANGNTYACDPSDVENDTLKPEPTRRPRRATRSVVDHRFNCRSSYPDYYGIEISGCDQGHEETPDEAHIDQLRAGVGGVGSPVPGFQTWTDCDPDGLVVIDGNRVVDCPGGFNVKSGDDVVFTGGNVIFDGEIKMTGGTLTFNSANPTPSLPPECQERVEFCLDESSADAAWVYLRDGDLGMNGGALIAHHTAFYLDNGVFSINGGSPPVWSAPIEGPFTSLAVWAEEPGSYSINGGASMELTGIFFTPFADPFSLSGGAPLTPQQAQFISYRAAISGSGQLILAPLEIDPIVDPAPEPLLIR